MPSIGIRELRQRASELLRMVQAGETFQVTDRGRPVAILAPLPDRGNLEQLRAVGDVTFATSDLRDLPDPVRLADGAPTASETLSRLRGDER